MDDAQQGGFALHSCEIARACGRVLALHRAYLVLLAAIETYPSLAVALY